ncbi:hypothetical protein GH714_003197 [Hevea brasiliensis]|uniref:Uncharacterized protein n=1 Tax=Hevea brasiliensis TaxID=3981 RepID=A0A6A6LNX2_HEVBR|nr:hypothetical protein GH714_003197 [Hevea brasiliensis]
MGGLEGLINILDSEGGFGALETQLLPEQAAFYLNNASRVSIPSAKSPKGAVGFPLPGHESYPENNSSIKMLEAAMQRLTNLCSVLNDMEPICVLNHVFVLREYMRECILGNFRRRVLAVLKTDNDLQRPSALESLIRRHMSIVHLAEQHISMDLTHGIREVLLTEAFSGPVSSLHLFEKPSEQLTGSATEVVCNWYIENIVKDISGAGILFTPLHRCIKSTRPVGGYFAESVTDLRELQAFVRIFGGYGVDRLDRMMKEHTAALLNCVDTSLRSNREVIEAIAGSMHSGDRIEREACLKQIVDLDTVIGFCIEAGQALAFDQLLAEAAGVVLEEGAPLIYSLLAGVVKHIPEEMPEKREIKRIRGVATRGLQQQYSLLGKVHECCDWGSEFVRMEREHHQRLSFSNGHVAFVKFATGIVLDSWSDANRSHLVAKLIFLDQLLLLKFSSMPLALLSVSPRHSPAVSLHASPSVKQPRGDSTPQYGTNDSGFFKGSSSHNQEHPYDTDSGSLRSTENKHWNVRRSGPLDYSSSRKTKFVEGSTSGSTGPSPLPRFAVSRSGPLLYK